MAELQERKIPTHVALILDGNGRWAKQHGMPRTYGHLRGCKRVEPVCRDAYDLGIKYLTFYAFSTENWRRPGEEVAELMRLLEKYAKEATSMSERYNMRFRAIGDIAGLPENLQAVLREMEEKSRDKTGLQAQIAVNYGGRDELRRAMVKLVKKAESEGKTMDELADSITEQSISSCLDTWDIPDPDLMIRTSGETRLSNYLIWQLAYAEYYFTDTLWPDFGRAELEKAIDYYNTRDRRFGGLSKK